MLLLQAGRRVQASRSLLYDHLDLLRLEWVLCERFFMKARRELVTLMLEEADEHEVNLNLESFNGSKVI